MHSPMIPPSGHSLPPEAMLNHEPYHQNMFNYPMRPPMHAQFGPPLPHPMLNPGFTHFLHPEYRIYELNKRLQQRSEDSDNLWWEAFVSQFFEDDAKLTMSFCLEDGPKRYCINRTLIPRFFRSVFEGGAIDLYFLPRHWKEIYHGPPPPPMPPSSSKNQGPPPPFPSFLTMDCEQANMITVLDKPMLTKIVSEGRLILDFLVMDDVLRIKRWHFIIRHHTELIPRNILAMQDPAVLEQLSKNVTRSGLTNTTLNYLRLCVILEPMAELMSRHKAYALSPRDCMKTTLFQKWQKIMGNNDGQLPHPSSAGGLPPHPPPHLLPLPGHHHMHHHPHHHGAPPLHLMGPGGRFMPGPGGPSPLLLTTPSNPSSSLPTTPTPGAGGPNPLTPAASSGAPSVPPTTTSTAAKPKTRRKRKSDNNPSTSSAGTSPGKKRGSVNATASSNTNATSTTNTPINPNASTPLSIMMPGGGNGMGPYGNPPPHGSGPPPPFYQPQHQGFSLNSPSAPGGPLPPFMGGPPFGGNGMQPQHMGGYPPGHPLAGLPPNLHPQGSQLPPLPFRPGGPSGPGGGAQIPPHLFPLASQDVMIVGEPTLMGGEFGDEDERLIARLENIQYSETEDFKPSFDFQQHSGNNGKNAPLNKNHNNTNINSNNPNSLGSGGPKKEFYNSSSLHGDEFSSSDPNENRVGGPGSALSFHQSAGGHSLGPILEETEGSDMLQHNHGRRFNSLPPPSGGDGPPPFRMHQQFVPSSPYHHPQQQQLGGPYSPSGAMRFRHPAHHPNKDDMEGAGGGPPPPYGGGPPASQGTQHYYPKYDGSPSQNPHHPNQGMPPPPYGANNNPNGRFLPPYNNHQDFYPHPSSHNHPPPGGGPPSRFLPPNNFALPPHHVLQNSSTPASSSFSTSSTLHHHASGGGQPNQPPLGPHSQTIRLPPHIPKQTSSSSQHQQHLYENSNNYPNPNSNNNNNTNSMLFPFDTANYNTDPGKEGLNGPHSLRNNDDSTDFLLGPSPHLHNAKEGGSTVLINHHAASSRPNSRGGNDNNLSNNNNNIKLDSLLNDIASVVGNNADEDLHANSLNNINNSNNNDNHSTGSSNNTTDNMLMGMRKPLSQSLLLGDESQIIMNPSNKLASLSGGMTGRPPSLPNNNTNGNNRTFHGLHNNKLGGGCGDNNNSPSLPSPFGNNNSLNAASGHHVSNNLSGSSHSLSPHILAASANSNKAIGFGDASPANSLK